MNIFPIINVIISQGSSTSDPEVLLVISKIVKRLSMGKVLYYDTIMDRPAPSTEIGSICYVESEEMVYYSDGSFWNEFPIGAGP